MSFAIDNAEQITDQIESLIAEICPSAEGRPMYGGKVFETTPGDASTMVCGHFIYKAHVGLEFGAGYRLEDADGLLEGSGKHRRHLKLRSVGDIADKDVPGFLRQAFALK
jgi:hypothetical protein